MSVPPATVMAPAALPVRGTGEAPAWHRWATIIGVHLALVVLWEVVVRVFEVRSFVLPAPSAILATLDNPNYAWLYNTLVTAAAVFGGYTLALVVGVLGALLFVTSKWLTLLLFPVLVTLNMIPKVAMGPLIIVWCWRRCRSATIRWRGGVFAWWPRR